MADWECLQITVTLESDLHCGDRPMGFISHTNRHVPQHVPFYALVPAIAARLKFPDMPGTFSGIEDFLHESIRFMPLFILDEKDRFLFPWDKDDRDVIDREFLSAKYGVALDYTSRGAIENRLFEIEVITARNRSTGTPVKLGGYLFCRPTKVKLDSGTVKLSENNGQYNINGIPVEELLLQSCWGGERNKGLGRMKKIQVNRASELQYNNVTVAPELTGDVPELKWPEKEKAPFLLQYSDDSKLISHVSGQVAPVSGRRFDPARGPGLLSDIPLISWQYGWVPQNDIFLEVLYNCCRALP